jgi:hypothetical protein
LGVGRGERVIDLGEHAILVEEAVADLVGIHVQANDVAAVVDAEREGQRGTRDVNLWCRAVLVAQERVDLALGIGIDARDLTAVVDVQLVPRAPGKSNRVYTP